MASDLDGVLDELYADAVAQFNAARVVVQDLQGKDDLSDDEQRQLATAQAQVSAALQQLSSIEGQRAQAAQHSQQASGYAQVVVLMTSVATAASTVSTAMSTLSSRLHDDTDPSSPSTLAEHQIIDRHIAALTEALKAVAALSPASIWDKK